MLHFIYTLSDPRTKIVRYVGKTNNLKGRLAVHLKEPKGSHKNNWLHQLKSLGLKPIMDVIEEVECSNDEWADRERFWIAHFRSVGIPLTNADSGGNSGKCLSDETKAKVRIARAKQMNVRTDHLPSFKGCKRSAETVAKIKAARAEQVFSKECREKMRLAKLGKKQTPQAIEAAHAPLRGTKRSAETRAKMTASKLAGWAKRKALLVHQTN